MRMKQFNEEKKIMNVSNLFQKEGAGKISSFTRVFVWMLFILFGYSLVALGQPAPVPYHYQPYLLESGIHNGRGDWETEAFPAYKEIVQVKEAPWLRLKFADANLGRHSYLMLTSLKDGAWQRLNALSLAQWRHTSAFFNGDAVQVELFVAPEDRGIFVRIDEIMVGEPPQNGLLPENICGMEDNRGPSNNPAVGRIVPRGCSGWIVNNGLQVTAGHCLALPGAEILEFNVPLSLPDGTIQQSLCKRWRR